MVVLAMPALMGVTGLRTSFDQRLLAAHNRERSAVGISPLRWDSELSRSADEWAAELIRTGELRHSPVETSGEVEGENLWAGTRDFYTPEDMVGLWVEERRHYRPGRFPANSRTGNVSDVGHYTQVMWRKTSHVGCAIRRSHDEEFLVCRYRQAGNVVGEVPF